MDPLRDRGLVDYSNRRSGWLVKFIAVEFNLDGLYFDVDVAHSFLK